MYIEFDGVAGMAGCCLGVRGEAVAALFVEGALTGVAGASVTVLARASGLVLGAGGKGETDTAVTDAVCAR